MNVLSLAYKYRKNNGEQSNVETTTAGGICSFGFSWCDGAIDALQSRLDAVSCGCWFRIRRGRSSQSDSEMECQHDNNKDDSSACHSFGDFEIRSS